MAWRGRSSSRASSHDAGTSCTAVALASFFVMPCCLTSPSRSTLPSLPCACDSSHPTADRSPPGTAVASTIASFGEGVLRRYRNVYFAATTERNAS